MSLEQFMKRAISGWMRVTGPQAEIVFSSRVRIARNLADLPFPMVIPTAQAEQVIQRLHDLLIHASPPGVLREAQLIRMCDLSSLEKQVLVEKHLISPVLAEESRNGAVIVSTNESVSLMINEEDHIRIQCLYPGLQLQEAWGLANQIDDWLEKHLAFAFDEPCGYLTSCPTNVGTGIRASVMLHLPALAISQHLSRILPAITQVGLAVRGMYGEGSEALGHLYQVSNQVTLGQSESEILEKLLNVVNQVLEREQSARQRLVQNSAIPLRDRLHRSYGLLANAYIMDSKEAMQRLSDVRLGVDLDWMPGVSASVMNEMMVMIQPGFLQEYADEQLDPQERDIRRARLLRERLLMEPGSGQSA
ncbi:protein arginine kinase [Pasteuria penetrans]|uniref:protein arginine kinase n=1 Tax=Pasteuria penetrans TaxID=86005 RepID=UPI000FA25C9E|nr:protein arginine kinase [Pasteuria penetrans]